MLIKCHECQREISDQASSCPGCGMPVKKPDTEEPIRRISSNPSKEKITNVRAGAAWEGGGCLLMLFGLIIALFAEPIRPVGVIILAVGFVVFIIGRFL